MTSTETNSLSKQFPELISEWDYENNGDLTPDMVSYGTAKKVWWKCPNGHSYKMQIINRTSKQRCGCPYCSVPAKKVLVGFNDLQTKYPSIAAEWHPTKNGNLKPYDVLCGTDKKVWWLGKCGHEYEQRIGNRVKGGNCPYCSHQKLLAGFNDFASEHPELLSEWDYEKNPIAPDTMMSHSHYKAWWKCPFGHSYQMRMYSRCSTAHSGCPICDKENHTSFPEQALFYYISNCFPDAVNSDRSVIGMELDIYIPSIRTAVEYDGKNWHRNNVYEMKKNDACKKKGVKLIRIREEGLPCLEGSCCFVRENVRLGKSLSKVINCAIIEMGSTADVDVDRDSAMIYESYIITRKKKSLYNTYPEIAKEWHPTKNGMLSAEMVSPKTYKEVWWLGKCGHEWRMSVQDRTDQQCGCPICSGKRIISGINDLLSKYPELCCEWDYKKNDQIGLFPDKVAPHSDKKAWWKCRVCGNIWQSKIDSRTRMNAGCPKCADQYIAKKKYKAVRCIETGVPYASIKDAEEQTGISRHCISNCCKGKQKTAGKNHWEFIK